MYQRARPADPDFSADEFLYSWVGRSSAPALALEASNTDPRAEHLRTAFQVVESKAFPKYPDQSFNRARYSASTDVLLPLRCDHEVLALATGAIPPVLVITQQAKRKGESPTTVQCTFAVEHAPEPNNYGHAQLVTTKDGVRLPHDAGKQLPATIKAQWREAVRSQCSLMPPPGGPKLLAYLRARFARHRPHRPAHPPES